MIGILHVGIILCFPLSLMFLYAILREWETHSVYAFIVAILIGSLSPQLLRLSGHFNLSFLIFLPALLRLLQLERVFKGWIYSLGVVWILLFTSFHAYYLMLGSSLLLGYWLISLIQDQDWKKKVPFYLIRLGIILFPLMLVSLFLLITDTVDDRPIHPYGYFAYQTRWEGLFLPAWGPIWEALNQLVEVRKVNMEARVYVGLVGSLTFLTLLIRWISNLMGKEKRSYFPEGTPPQLKIWVQFSLLILLFSTAFPFSLGLRDLLDHFPILKQFRSLGRFGWIFFYVWSLFTAVVLFHYFNKLCRKMGPLLAYVFLGGTLIFWAWEGSIFLQERKEAVSHEENPFIRYKGEYKELMSRNNLSSWDFQSIIPSPFYHIGSEKFSPIHIDNDVFKESLKASYELRVPMGTGFLPRSSLIQALNILQLNSYPWLEREMLDELVQDRPVLLMGKDIGEAYDPAGLLKRGKLIDKSGELQLRQLSLEDLAHQAPTFWTNIPQEKWAVRKDGSWQTLEPPKVWYQGFEDKAPYSAEFGAETYSHKHGKQVLFNQQLIPYVSGDTLNLSIWVKADLRRDAFPHIHLYLTDENGGEVAHTKLDPKYSNDIYQNWVRVQHMFILQSNSHSIRIEVHGKFAEVESLLLAPTKETIGWETANGQLWVDNYPIPTE